MAKRVAEREGRSEVERAQYAYTQSLVVEELNDKGAKLGEYREAREIIFLPSGERSERLIGTPFSGLKQLKLTSEDFQDIREIQPMLFTLQRLFLYETKLKGEEEMDGVLCWVLQVRPRQMLSGMRFFDGLFWVDQRDYSIVRSEGRAVPQVHSTHAEKENLFPAFTTIRQQIGNFWFPTVTRADDTLYFARGPLRIRLTIRYREYKRFTAESKVTG